MLADDRLTPEALAARDRAFDLCAMAIAEARAEWAAERELAEAA